ncbi:hypothetical protein ACFOW4_13295 [Micromonospora sp. GCM10011542]|uniref:hypothetical protein n=1 Tax=Micromonospora sp. GCM10011542 TaxID=3317337 RepID=UPI0036117D04
MVLDIIGDFTVLIVRDIAEDPRSGAHEDFREQLTEVAQDTVDFDRKTSAADRLPGITGAGCRFDACLGRPPAGERAATGLPVGGRVQTDRAQWICNTASRLKPR